MMSLIATPLSPPAYRRPCRAICRAARTAMAVRWLEARVHSPPSAKPPRRSGGAPHQVQPMLDGEAVARLPLVPRPRQTCGCRPPQMVEALTAVQSAAEVLAHLRPLVVQVALWVPEACQAHHRGLWCLQAVRPRCRGTEALLARLCSRLQGPCSVSSTVSTAFTWPLTIKVAGARQFSLIAARICCAGALA